MTLKTKNKSLEVDNSFVEKVVKPLNKSICCDKKFETI